MFAIEDKRIRQGHSAESRYFLDELPKTIRSNWSARQNSAKDWYHATIRRRNTREFLRMGRTSSGECFSEQGQDATFCMWMPSHQWMDRHLEERVSPYRTVNDCPAPPDQKIGIGRHDRNQEAQSRYRR